jgi:cytoskeletal protein CcmA (bactofilin family)
MPSIISPGLQVTGNLICDGDVQVEGAIEGDIRARHVTVGEAGSIVGHTIAERVVVSGKVNGKITAPTVVMHPSAKVFGDIAHETLTIETGAHFEGKCMRIGADAKSAEDEKTFASVKRQIHQVSPNSAEEAAEKQQAAAT